jgi:hypothetical protein
VSRRVHFTFNVGEGPSIGAAVFWQDALARGLTRVISENWPTSAKLDESRAAWWNVEPWGTGAVLEFDSGALAFVHVGFGNADVRVAAETEQKARAALDEVKELLPRAVRDREGRVPVTFWTYSPHGPMPMGRVLSVPAWEEISANYAPETAEPLARLMTGTYHGGEASSSSGTVRRAPGRRLRFARSRASGPPGAIPTTSPTPSASLATSLTTCSR